MMANLQGQRATPASYSPCQDMIHADQQADESAACYFACLPGGRLFVR
jgi:hypothetical protein